MVLGLHRGTVLQRPVVISDGMGRTQRRNLDDAPAASRIYDPRRRLDPHGFGDSIADECVFGGPVGADVFWTAVRVRVHHLNVVRFLYTNLYLGRVDTNSGKK